MHFWSKFGNPDFNPWWLIARRNSQTQNGVHFDFEVKFDLEGQGHSPPKNNRYLHIWSKFCDPSLNSCWVIVRTSSWLMETRTYTQTDRRTHTHTQATTIPEGHNWPRVKTHIPWIYYVSCSPKGHRRLFVWKNGPIVWHLVHVLLDNMSIYLGIHENRICY